jgi:bifunctional enzyme CysN/CysC
MQNLREQMNVVIVGHVDHGKSTLIGRLLADTGSLPQGKLEQVKENCKRNAKPFEYAFLLDALKDERSQGITIDTARSFFKSKKRDYIIIDAPGHIEFLKNMITGAARAEAAVLVIDAKEGIKENSKRHGYMMSFLGIKNITVVVNKMDLVNYDQKVFEQIKREYLEFLKEINLVPQSFIPIAAREGDNMVNLSSNMPWYKELSVLDALDQFQKQPSKTEQALRFPIQDIYKFTEEEDDRRIFSGRVESGTLHTGDDVIFLPSNKRSKITSIEGFNLPKQNEAFAGQSTGVCLETQIYIRPGEIMCRAKDKLPHVTNKFKTNIFWMGKQPLVKGKNYKLKITTQHVPVVLSEIISVLDASELSSITNKPQVDRHDVAECVFEALKPIAFDEITHISETGRFVIVDNYEIAGGGIILSPVFETDTALNKHIKERDFKWVRSDITPEKRAVKYQHKPALIIFTGESTEKKEAIAKALEEELFKMGKYTYYLGVPGDVMETGSSNDRTLSKMRYLTQLGETAHILTDAGLILITNVSDIDDYELEMIKSLNRPNKSIVINVGENVFSAGHVDLTLADTIETPAAVREIVNLLIRSVVLDPEFSI